MKITTTRFGEIDFAKEEIIDFPEGLLGFDDFHGFVILNPNDGGPFRWLQSTEDGALAFVIIEPLSFMFEYDLEVSDSDAAFLGLTNPQDAVVYSIVTIPENFQDMTANLQGPLIINSKSRKGRQIISGNSKHHIKTRIIDEMTKRAGKIKDVKDSLEPDKKEGQG